jgi:hypothetical protein
MSRLVTLPALLAAAPTWACTVCGIGQENTEWAYVAMTAVLSLLPLALIGGVAGWLYVRARAHEAERASGESVPAAVTTERGQG